MQPHGFLILQKEALVEDAHFATIILRHLAATLSSTLTKIQPPRAIDTLLSMLGPSHASLG